MTCWQTQLFVVTGCHLWWLVINKVWNDDCVSHYCELIVPYVIDMVTAKSANVIGSQLEKEMYVWIL